MPVILNLVAIPNGARSDGMLALSIVVAPRLADARSLGAYPDMLDWTARLAEAPPHILLRLGSSLLEAQMDADALRPDLWDALFDEGTPVSPFEFDDASERLVNSYRTGEALSIVRAGYQTLIATSPGQLPQAALTGDLFSSLILADAERDIERIVADHRSRRFRQQLDSRGIIEPEPQSAEDTLKDFELYRRMPQPGPDAPDSVPRSEAELAEIVDFHKAITALSAHPSLMRALGLVVDVIVPASEVQAAGMLGMALATASVERFEPARGFEDVALMTPRVLYRHHPPTATLPAVFAAASQQDQTIAEGFLGLPEDQFQLLDLDIDGALAKLVNLAAMLPRASRTPTADGALPALRSAGLSLALHDRGNEVVRALRRAAELNKALETQPGGNGPPLEAGDLVRGYRLDIWSGSSGRWHSLHRRQATYLFGEDAATRLEVEDEGFSQFAAASPAPDPTRAEDPSLPPIHTDLYVHEALARWTGWSLSAPRPGRPIHRSEEHDPLKPDPSADELVTAFPMRQSFKPVPRSLPRLRFGERYRVRVRIVDLAGNSPPVLAVDTGPLGSPDYPVALPQAPEAQPYLRYEPVPHPLLVLRQVPEDRRPALDRLVIRTFNSDPMLDGVASTDTEERHVAPPRTSVDMAERHGLFDNPAGQLRGESATFAMLVARDDAAFGTIEIGSPPTETPIESKAQLPVHYHPDPLARAAAFRFLPGVAPGQVLFAGAAGLVTRTDDPTGEAGPVLQVGFGEGWPNRQAFRIVGKEGDAPPDWDPGERVLTISLPKALATEVRLSSALADADLELMGLWAWERAFLDEHARLVILAADDSLADRMEDNARLAAQLSRLALEGGQWALTPSIPLHLIHAVQQPLGRPAFVCRAPAGPVRDPSIFAGRRTPATAPLIAMRGLNSPDATLVGDLKIHLASTGQIELRASWRDIAEAQDEEDGVSFTDATAMLEPIRLDRPEGEIPAQGADGRSVAVVIAPDHVSFTPEGFGASSRPAAAPIQRFGDTKHRIVRYQAIATSRFVGDFPADQSLNFTRTSESVSVSVPNSARPPAPKIVQILPTFGWRREQTGTLASSVRLGRGVRIYIEWPWFASGEGELLGVVLWRPNRTPPDAQERRDRFAGLVTEWGLDPLRRSGRLNLMPALSDLTDATVKMEVVQLPEARIEIDVAGHPVSFDHERGLWYADVTLAAEFAYMPFLRLALVRFQPDSIRGAEISAVAPAEFIQIAPDRSVVLIADPVTPRLYRLVVAGRAPTPSGVAPWRNRIEVAIEERRQDLTTDLGWRAVSPAIAKVTPLATGTDAPSVLFSGLVEFAATPASGRYRLVLREYETWRIDEPEPAFELLLGLGVSEVVGDHAFTARQAMALASRRLRAAARVNLAERDHPFVVTSRAIERLGFAVVGPRTGSRLVYAEFIAIEPSAISKDLSADPDIIGGGAPGDEPGPEPEETPAWPPYAGPPTGFLPRWEEVPEIDPESGDTVSAFVKLAQAMLNATDVVPLPLVVDGLLGPLTEAAIRAFRTANLMPDSGGLDTPAWVRLALAAPFPTLEPGIGQPPMAGPPIALVQRLLNTEANVPLEEDGTYSSDTAARVSAFQAERGLDPSGIVDPETWLELAGLFDLMQPAGSERIVLEFDRARLLAGRPPFQLVERAPVEGAAVPVSDPLDEDWSDRSGTWLELRDVTGRPLFRRVFGQSLARAPEVPSGHGEPLGRPGSPPDQATFVSLVPVLGAARSLVVFATLDPDRAAAAPIATFEPW
jgi:peptidoglycan hydrolase-like protein with peptidoglycan-binding domain